MHLKSVTIENFRGFSKLQLELDETTVLIGENNTGKTSVLDALRLCLSRPLSRRGNPFEDHDYHLASDKVRPADAGKLIITLDFAEEKKNEWPPEVIQAMADMLALHSGDINHVTLRVTSEYEKSLGDFVADWDFLDAVGKPIPKAKPVKNLVAVQQLNPIYYLSALRDAARDFGARSAFWAPFLRNPSIPLKIQQQLEKELSELNDRIIKAEPRLQEVKAKITKAQTLVSLGANDTVSIEALPGKVWDMLSRARVNIAGTTGANLPLDRHGSGTQSLAAVFLFEAFLDAGVGHSDPFSQPILEIEEPETHLHPSAVRALWSTLKSIKGQKIIATHSGDLLSEVPLSAIRRLRRSGAKIEVRQVDSAKLTADESRMIHFHIRRTRGDLLFARSWLMHEGETEYWVLAEAARVLGVNLEQVGVRLVEYRHAAAAPFVKLADDLGIDWHCVTDGDLAKKELLNLLNGRDQDAHLTILPFPNIELLLCQRGFGQIYEANIAQQKKANLSAKPGEADYWPQVLKCQSRGYKTECAVKVADSIRKQGSTSVPKELAAALKKAVDMAK